jgi:hypothetical protein
MSPSPQDTQIQGGNVVHMPDGSTHTFPANATPEQMQAALRLSIPTAQHPEMGIPGGVKPGNIDNATVNGAIDFLRPMLANIGGGLAATGVAMVPGLGESGIAEVGARTQGYALVDALMQQLKTGETPSFGESLGEGEKQALINEVAQKITTGLFRGVKAVRNADQPEIYNFKPTTSQAMESYGYHILGNLSKFAEDFGASGAKSEALDRAGGAGFSQALKFANQLNGRLSSTNADPVKLADKIKATLGDALENSGPTISKLVDSNGKSISYPISNQYQPSKEAVDVLRGGKNPFQKIDDVIQDPDRLAKVLTASQVIGDSSGNVRKDLQSYQFMRMVNDATTKDAQGNIRIDPKKINSVWNDANMQTSLDTLYGKANRQNVSDFIKNIQTTQDPMHSYPIARQVRMMAGGFTLAHSLLSGNLSLGSAAVSTGLFVPTAVMGRLLTNPSVARTLVAAVGGEPLESGAAKWTARALTNALQGSAVALVDAEGKKQWGELQKQPDGTVKFVEGNR